MRKTADGRRKETMAGNDVNGKCLGMERKIKPKELHLEGWGNKVESGR